MASTTGFIEANDGTKLFTRHWISDAPAASMVLVHGLSEHSGRWEHVGEFFSSAGFDVHSIDLRGHGQSGGARIDVDSFDDYLDDVEIMMASVAALGRPIVMYGHSMGGLICLAYNLDDRVRPEALVLSAPAIDADVPVALRAVARILGRVLPGAKLPSTIKGEDLSRDPTVGAAYFADPLVHTKGTARFGVQFMDKMRHVQKSLGTLDVPTLVIHGTADPIVPPGVSAPLAAVASVERKLFPGFRHELHNEPDADDVLNHVLGWLHTTLEAAHTEA